MDKEIYKLDDKIHLFDGNEIMVFCAESKTAFKKWVVMTDYDTTFRELLKEARVPISKGYVAYIIIESLFDGVIYQFGNYDLKNVYKHGETRGTRNARPSYRLHHSNSVLNSVGAIPNRCWHWRVHQRKEMKNYET